MGVVWCADIMGVCGECVGVCLYGAYMGVVYAYGCYNTCYRYMGLCALCVACGICGRVERCTNDIQLCSYVGYVIIEMVIIYNIVCYINHISICYIMLDDCYVLMRLFVIDCTDLLYRASSLLFVCIMLCVCMMYVYVYIQPITLKPYNYNTFISLQCAICLYMGMCWVSCQSGMMWMCRLCIDYV